MKKLILKISLITLFAGAFFINTSNAQPINVGGGLVIGTSYPHFGLKVNGTYGMDFLLENLSASAAFTFFIPSTPVNTTYSRWAIDIDGHYKFYSMEKFDFYALAGINITSYTEKWDDFLGDVHKTSGTKPGLNAGAGAIYKFTDNLKGFGEFKYIMGRYDQAEITFGVLFAL
ncbi:MAG: outer membrane beta-barrel protein [Bacteroidales bacterium]|jgi:opacity protein-like surface antigen|nr:outer membrane beta-barrel protein [Bacteroidales bacterium]